MLWRFFRKTLNRLVSVLGTIGLLVVLSNGYASADAPASADQAARSKLERIKDNAENRTETTPANRNVESPNSDIGLKMGNSWKSVLIFFAVLFIAIGIWKKVVATKFTANETDFQVLNRIALTSRTQLIKVLIDGELVVLAVGGESVTTVGSSVQRDGDKVPG